tara:strand:- start:156 stop:1127 length:972 start_codon:yes stop_codon:yes gene_type:complete
MRLPGLDVLNAAELYRLTEISSEEDSSDSNDGCTLVSTKPKPKPTAKRKSQSRVPRGGAAGKRAKTALAALHTPRAKRATSDLSSLSHAELIQQMHNVIQQQANLANEIQRRFIAASAAAPAADGDGEDGDGEDGVEDSDEFSGSDDESDFNGGCALKDLDYSKRRAAKGGGGGDSDGGSSSGLMHCRRAGLAREGKAVLARVAASAMPLPRTTPPPSSSAGDAAAAVVAPRRRHAMPSSSSVKEYLWGVDPSLTALIERYAQPVPQASAAAAVTMYYGTERQQQRQKHRDNLRGELSTCQGLLMSIRVLRRRVCMFGSDLSA